uniref:Uncharacterized protein n=1 Tax=Triticum urartu TaxID=4572 RepID=A0A8R7UN15_TRIUA
SPSLLLLGSISGLPQLPHLLLSRLHIRAHAAARSASTGPAAVGAASSVPHPSRSQSCPEIAPSLIHLMKLFQHQGEELFVPTYFPRFNGLVVNICLRKSIYVNSK